MYTRNGVPGIAKSTGQVWQRAQDLFEELAEDIPDTTEEVDAEQLPEPDAVETTPQQ
jgi:hypothetical protein